MDEFENLQETANERQTILQKIDSVIKLKYIAICLGLLVISFVALVYLGVFHKHSGNIVKVLDESACVKGGKVIYECNRCGKLYEATISSHQIVDGKCEVCGRRTTDIKAYTWYEGPNTNDKWSYKYYLMNAYVDSAYSVDRGLAVLVRYYPVCKKCHMTGETSNNIRINFANAYYTDNSYSILYYCEGCNEVTHVQFKVD